MMKFLIDADTPYSLIRILTSNGLKAVHVKDVLKFATDDKNYHPGRSIKIYIIELTIKSL